MKSLTEWVLLLSLLPSWSVQEGAGAGPPGTGSLGDRRLSQPNKFQLQNHAEFAELHSSERLPSNIFKRKSFVCSLIIKLRLTDF